MKQRSYIFCAISILLFIGGLIAFINLQIRRWEEFEYADYMKSSFLPEYFNKEKKWPTSTDQVLVDLNQKLASGNYSDEGIRLLIDAHNRSHPQLHQISADDTSYHGKLRFLWL